MKWKKKQESYSALFMQAPEIRQGGGHGWGSLLIGCLLLFLGLAGTAWAFVSSFALPAHLPLLLALAACLSLLLTAGYRWRFADILLFLLSAALCLFLWRFQSEIVQGFLCTVNCITKAYTENSPFEFPTFLVEEMTDLERQRCCTMFVGACMVPVAGALSWAVFRRRSFVCSFVFTFPFLLAGLMFTITPNLCAMTMLLVFWAGLAFLPARARCYVGKQHFSSGIQRLPAASLLVLALMTGVISLLLFVIPMEEYQRPKQVDDLRVSLEMTGQRLVEQVSNSLLFSGSRDQANLENETDGFSGKTVLEVQSSRGTDLRLRGFTGSVYNGSSWSQLPEDEYTLLDESLAGTSPLNLSGFLGKDLFSSVRVSVRNVGASREILYAPYALATTPEEFPEADYVHDSFLRGDWMTAPLEYSMDCLDVQSSFLYGDRELAAEAYLQCIQTDDASGQELPFSEGLYFMDGSEYAREEMRKLYCTPVSDDLLAALPEPLHTWMEEEAEYSTFVYDHYLDVPEDLKKTLLDSFYPDAQPVGLPFDNVISQVELMVSTSATYSLSAPQTPQGEDFIEYFVTESHEGYCVHFASTAVMLLRSMGIPARYVEGFALSWDELEEAGPEGWVEVKDSRSHAWAEAYCPGFGWVPVEATPGGGTIPMSSDEAESEPASSEPEEVSSASEPASSVSQPVSSRPTSENLSSVSSYAEQEEERDTSPIWQILFCVLGVILFCGLLVLLFLLRRSLREKRYLRLPANRSVALMYRHALGAVRFGAQMDPRLRELAEKAKFSRKGVTEEERGEARRLLTQLYAKTARKLPLWKRVLLFLWKG